MPFPRLTFTIFTGNSPLLPSPLSHKSRIDERRRRATTGRARARARVSFRRSTRRRGRGSPPRTTTTAMRTRTRSRFRLGMVVDGLRRMSTCTSQRPTSVPAPAYQQQYGYLQEHQRAHRNQHAFSARRDRVARAPAPHAQFFRGGTLRCPWARRWLAMFSDVYPRLITHKPR